MLLIEHYFPRFPHFLFFSFSPHACSQLCICGLVSKWHVGSYVIPRIWYFRSSCRSWIPPPSWTIWSIYFCHFLNMPTQCATSIFNPKEASCSLAVFPRIDRVLRGTTVPVSTRAGPQRVSRVRPVAAARVCRHHCGNVHAIFVTVFPCLPTDRQFGSNNGTF